MNSQTLGGLASDQKIENVFHAFGYSIPVGKDGRRMWPNTSEPPKGCCEQYENLRWPPVAMSCVGAMLKVQIGGLETISLRSEQSRRLRTARQ